MAALYNDIWEISMNIAIPLLLIVETFCLFLSLKAGEIIYNKLCLKRIIEKRYIKHYEITENEKAFSMQVDGTAESRRISWTPPAIRHVDMADISVPDVTLA